MGYLGWQALLYEVSYGVDVITEYHWDFVTASLTQRHTQHSHVTVSHHAAPKSFSLNFSEDYVVSFKMNSGLQNIVISLGAMQREQIYCFSPETLLTIVKFVRRVLSCPSDSIR